MERRIDSAVIKRLQRTYSAAHLIIRPIHMTQSPNAKQKEA
jgi:hypothetical protein